MKPVATKKWRAFLKSRGLILIRITDNHENWNLPDGSLLRPVVFWHNKPEVPGFQIQTCLKTLGISKTEFLEAVKKL